jgi:signal peptidase II
MAPSKGRPALRLWLIVTSILVFVIDFITKWMAVVHLAPNWAAGIPYGRRVPVIPGCLDFLFAANTGGAFSIFDNMPWLITGVSSLMIIGIAIWAWRIPYRYRIIELAFGLIIGGALGNLVDRIRLHYVVDFVHAYIFIGGKEHYWPTFNVADMAIVTGIGLFLYLSVFTKILEPAREPESTEPAPE